MGGGVAQVRIGVEEGLRPIAVVNVPVDHRHARRRPGGTQRRDRDRDVVEKAEAARAVARGVVAWWTDHRKRDPCPAQRRCMRGLDRRAGG